MDDKKTENTPATELEDKDLDQATGGATDLGDRPSLTGGKGGRAGKRTGTRM